MKNILLLSWLLIAAACSNEGDLKPAEIIYGQDLCHACSMIISEIRFSAQYIDENGQVRKFDDIGCMMEYLNQNKPKSEVAAYFVRDYFTNNWINAKNAHFVYSDKLITPMGHGIAALSSKEDMKKIVPEIHLKYLGTFDEAAKNIR
ncbi:MAG: hypothetical protein GTN99_02580 [Candidatus Dadabacteria bacterium]|nr:hypothetical protein [Candidatus Dadabacteria bacterium]NIT13151.1 hypothetical protein [Candidatus Dadabacteria bacterium]